ncbi:hypothetical protein HER32_11955 [Hymenobacter sp. BT18]|uniref:hypothetical protein n=1 Tax=Hymenobacter sp. BT18 TaxID=2835648 RepID=UPI00143E9C86|nr:hypothetical protein [Hymenobacter sp. BT18]QIX61856.1 hypothetical protein HER32_11955 [Hymenobacter sp. BT18]
MAQEQILLKLDVDYNDKRVVELQKQLNENKQAVQDLNKAFKEGRISADDLAAGQVRLKNEASTLQKEQAVLNKASRDFAKANQEAAGSIDQLKAKAAQLTAQYNALGKEERENTAAGKALQAELLAVNEELKAGGFAVGDFRRNVGNYAGSIGPLVQELVKLQEQQKAVGEGSEEYKKITTQIGFVTQAVREAGAKSGLSFEQAEAKVKEYGESIRPVVQEIIRLEKEQENLDESSDAYSRIGFKLAATQKKLAEAPVETKKFGTALVEAAKGSDTLGGAVGRVTGLQERFTQAQGLARTALGGTATATNVLKVAMLALPIFLIIAALGTLYTYLTRTAEGTRLVENVFAQVEATINVVIDRLGVVGKAVMQVLSGDFAQAAKTATGAFKGIGDEIEREVKLAGDLSKARQQLDRDTVNNIDTNKRLLNEVERLKNVRDNEANSLAVRRKANEDAFAKELEREKTLADLARRRIAILKAEIDQRGGFDKVSLEQLREYKEAQNELSDILEDAAGKQNELITNRFALNKEGMEKEKEARNKLDEAMLASYEEEKRLQELKEAQAEKQLEDDIKVAANKLAEEERAYQQSLNDLDFFLAGRKRAIEKDKATGQITEEEYQKALYLLDMSSFEARELIQKKFNKSTAELVGQRADREIAEEGRVTEKVQAETEKRIETAVALGQAMGQLFADTLSQQGVTLQGFLGKFIVLILDALEKQVLAQQAAATAASLASPESVATYGTAGILKAALINGLIVAAFESAKFAISAGTQTEFATGGGIEGPGTGTSDSIPAYGPGNYSGAPRYKLSNGEHVWTAQEVQNAGGHKAVEAMRAQFKHPLSSLQALLPQTAFATGGGVLAPGIADGGATQRAASAAVSGLDYTELARAMAQQPVFVKVRDVTNAQQRKAIITNKITLGK